MDRMACAWLERFHYHVHLLEHPEREGRPLVLYREQGGRTRVLCASPAVERAGVRPGMALPDARALVPDLEAEPEDPFAGAERLQALGEVALELGPRVVPLPPDAIAVEIGGSSHLFGGEGPLLQALAGRLARVGFGGRTAIADGWVAARLLAEHGPRDRLIVPPGEQARALGPLPVRALLPGIEHHLDPGGLAEPETFARRFLEAMELLAVRRVRDLAALPEGAVADRFGPVGRLLHDRARGISEASPASLRPASEIREVLELEGLCDGWEPLLFQLKRLLDRTALRLQARGEAALRLHLELLHHPDGVSEVEVVLGRATRCPKTLHRVLRERLSAPTQEAACGQAPNMRTVRHSASGPRRGDDACLAASGGAGTPTPAHGGVRGAVSEPPRRLQGPVTQVELRVSEAERSEGNQRDLVLAAERRGEDVPDLVERLRAFLGEAAVCSPRLVDTHRPEAAWAPGPFPPPPRAAASAEAERGAAAPPRPLVLLRDPEPGMRWQGRPVRVAARGPVERLSGEWWADEAGFDRSYRLVVLPGGERLWVCRDEARGDVRVVGAFD